MSMEQVVMAGISSAGIGMAGTSNAAAAQVRVEQA